MTEKRNPTEEEVASTASDLIDWGPAQVSSEIDLDVMISLVTEILGMEPMITERDVILSDLDEERQTPPTYSVLMLP